MIVHVCVYCSVCVYIISPIELNGTPIPYLSELDCYLSTCQSLCLSVFNTYL